jgi:hypothetical protein
MFLRALDAFLGNDRYTKRFSSVASVGTTARAPTISPLSHAPKVQGRAREIYRLLMRALVSHGYPPERANRWANADDRSGMPPFEGDGYPYL